MKVFTEYDLSEHNSYRIRAVCRRALFPETETDFRQIYSAEGGGKKILLGGGYNVILSRSYYAEDFVIVGRPYSSFSLESEEIIAAEAGADIRAISEFAWQAGLTGFEMFYDIPSSVGGAVVMNAGASGEEIKDVLVKVRFLDLADLRVKEVYRDEIGFEYRNSFFQRNTDKVVLKAWFRLSKGDKDAIRLKMDSVKAARWAKQPKELPNAGSVFKRPPGFYVGQMIDELGLKGYTVGGAKVSEKHGGFIVNYNNATGEDVLSLIAFIRESVYSKFGVALEVEQRVI